MDTPRRSGVELMIGLWYRVMALQQEKIRLRQPRWELLALAVGSGEKAVDAWRRLYPGSKPKFANNYYTRLLSNHPEIRDRIDQVMDEIGERMIDHAALSRADIEKMYVENLEHAKGVSKTMIDPETGKKEKIHLHRNHAAINSAIKGIADVNGLSAAAVRKQPKGEADPEAAISFDQLLKSVIRKATMMRGRELEPDELAAIRALGDAGADGAESGSDSDEPPTPLRSVS